MTVLALVKNGLYCNKLGSKNVSMLNQYVPVTQNMHSTSTLQNHARGLFTNIIFSPKYMHQIKLRAKCETAELCVMVLSISYSRYN